MRYLLTAILALVSWGFFVVSGPAERVSAEGTRSTYAAESSALSIGAVPRARLQVASVEVVPPTQSGVCGPNNDLITLFDQPTGVVLVSDTMWAASTRVITYSATAGFVIEGQSVFEFDDSNVPCLVSVIPPTQSGVCGPNNDLITLYDQPTGVVLVSDTMWGASTRIITYSATTGFAVEGQSVFEFDDSNIPCPELTAPYEPTQTAICGPNNDTITIPAQPAGIIVPPMDTGWVANVRTITFSAAEGYVIEGQSIFEYTDANTPCPTTLIPPVVEALCGPNNDNVILFPQTLEVEPAVDSGWVDGTRTITYEPAPGFVIDGQSVFVFEDENLPCPTIEPGTTPTPSPTVAPTQVPAPTEQPEAPPTTPGNPPAVTGLPNTGSGKSGPGSLIALMALIGTLAMIPVLRKSRR